MIAGSTHLFSLDWIVRMISWTCIRISYASGWSCVCVYVRGACHEDLCPDAIFYMYRAELKRHGFMGERRRVYIYFSYFWLVVFKNHILSLLMASKHRDGRLLWFCPMGTVPFSHDSRTCLVNRLVKVPDSCGMFKNIGNCEGDICKNRFFTTGKKYA